MPRNPTRDTTDLPHVWAINWNFHRVASSNLVQHSRLRWRRWPTTEQQIFSNLLLLLLPNPVRSFFSESCKFNIHKIIPPSRTTSSLQQHHPPKKFQRRPDLVFTIPQVYVIYICYPYRSQTLNANSAMETDYLRSFLQSQWLKIFVIHEILVRPRYIMESVTNYWNTGIALTHNDD